MSHPPGWYPDPSGAPGQRWWDGQQWGQSAATGYGAGAYGATGYAPVVVQQGNGVAVAGFVLGLLAMFVNTWWSVCIVGIILSSFGLARAGALRRSGVVETRGVLAGWGLGLSIAAGFKTLFLFPFTFGLL